MKHKHLQKPNLVLDMLEIILVFILVDLLREGNQRLGISRLGDVLLYLAQKEVPLFSGKPFFLELLKGVQLPDVRLSFPK